MGTIDIIKDVTSQVAILTLRTDDIGLFIEGVIVVGKLKKKIKHDEPPFVSPVLKSVDWYNGEAGQKDQSESDGVPAKPLLKVTCSSTALGGTTVDGKLFLCYRRDLAVRRDGFFSVVSAS